jgi:Prokaryotic membrane lipoprotein lipid attachment site
MKKILFVIVVALAIAGCTKGKDAVEEPGPGPTEWQVDGINTDGIPTSHTIIKVVQ